MTAVVSERPPWLPDVCSHSAAVGARIESCAAVTGTLPLQGLQSDHLFACGIVLPTTVDATECPRSKRREDQPQLQSARTHSHTHTCVDTRTPAKMLVFLV